MLTELVQYEYRAVDDEITGLSQSEWNGKTLLHIAVHRGWMGRSAGELNLNAGDTCLNPLVRQLIDRVAGPFRWKLRQVWEPLDRAEMRELQGRVDGIVVGGGGLFLREQPGTDLSRSGWTWNCSLEALEEITKPLLVLAVGYNRFRGHDEFEPIFRRHVNKICEISKFFGLRNTGSIRAVQAYLATDELRKKPVLQTCPTTLIWQLLPKYRAIVKQHDRSGTFALGLNCAFDRPELRFGNKADNILRRIAWVAERAQAKGWQIHVVAHKLIDRKIEPYLDEANVNYKTHDVSNGTPADIMTVYANLSLCVGLRGHAQMIPFGLRRPILSIVSHEKLQYFLDDVGHPEWGVDVNDERFQEKLIDKIAMVATNIDGVRQTLAEVQERLWVRTLNNFPAIARALN